MEIGERRCADECELCGHKGMEGNKQEEKPKDMSECSCADECPTSADGFARGSKEMGGEKGSVEISRGRVRRMDEGKWEKGSVESSERRCAEEHERERKRVRRRDQWTMSERA